MKEKKRRAAQFVLWNTQTQQLLLALTLATVIYTIFPGFFVYPTFLFFNVLLSLQLTRRLTLQMSVQRVVGSMMGSVLGFIVVLLIPDQFMIYFLPLGLFLATYLSYISMNAFVPIMLIILLMIMSDNYDNNALYYISQRVVAAFVGVSISLFTTYIYRSQTETFLHRFYRIAHKLDQKFTVCVEALLANNALEDYQKKALIADIQKLRAIRERILHEQTFFHKEDQAFVACIQAFADYYMSVQILSQMSRSLAPATREQLQAFFHVPQQTKNKANAKDDVIVNYHFLEIVRTKKALDAFFENESIE